MFRFLFKDATGNNIALSMLSEIFVNTGGNQLLDTQLDLTFIRIDAEHLGFHHLADSQYILRMVDMFFGADFADMDEALNTLCELNKGAELHQAYDGTFNDRAYWKPPRHLSPWIAERLLESQRDTAGVPIHRQNYDFYSVPLFEDVTGLSNLLDPRHLRYMDEAFDPRLQFAMCLGLLLGRLFKVGKTQSFLISAGTAICGGSAIAALGPVTEASEEEMAVAMGTVFVLNSVALFIFPVIGGVMHLSQTQFGLWAALAIHDTSSVVGATAKYGAVALAIGTTVKLARAMWIVPLTLGVAAVKKSRTRVQWPWFILLFVLAAVMNSYVPWLRSLYPELARLGRVGLGVTLFLIGTGISRETIRDVGARPLIQGVLLWIVVGSVSLWAIVEGWIHL